MAPTDAAAADKQTSQHMDARTEAQARTAGLPVLSGADGLPRRDVGLPMINGEAVASLSTCSTNLHRSCDFHNAQLYQTYLREWRRPAPRHCLNETQPPVVVPELYLDRLGVNMEPVCEELAHLHPQTPGAPRA